MEKSYKCVCGREFKSSQAINGHKANCIEHLKTQFDNAEEILANRQFKATTSGKNTTEARKIRSELNKQQKLQLWVAEQHKCERCGKVMTEYYGSGRFCSEFCARSNPRSKDTKLKIADALKNNTYNVARTKISSKDRSLRYREKYYRMPNYCKVCGVALPYELRYRKTCSKTCYSILNSANGGLKEGSVKNYKAGYYKGIRCDSSWELAFLVYNLDHGIPIKRNTEGFNYKLHNQEHKYYPDFKINDTYIEIKNYINEMVQAKIDYFPYKDKYQLLLYNDLKLYIDYCEKTYGKNYWLSLYD